MKKMIKKINVKLKISHLKLLKKREKKQENLIFFNKDILLIINAP